MTDWLSAEEAQRRLGVRAQTLYAYVSRGRIRAAADPADPRRSRYRASDVGVLAERKARGRKAAEVARGAIAWGEPVLASAITTVRDGHLYYRGRDAVVLAKAETLEHAARLLRGGLGDPPTDVPSTPPGPTAKARAFAALATRASVDPSAQGRSEADLADEAAALLDVMATAIAGEAEEGPIHERLGRAWRVRREGWPLLRRALVLLADHELNASTFAARVAASTGAALSASALAGLAALSGPRHGGVAADAEAFALRAARRGDIGKFAKGAAPPGFGHPLYPEGDPRAEALLEAFEPPPALARLRAMVEEATGLSPNVDFALVALRQALGLAPDAPFALFALARSAGWMAHAMEQVASGDLIRPRARYVGSDPGG
jgi:citrate synthase